MGAFAASEFFQKSGQHTLGNGVKNFAYFQLQPGIEVFALNGHFSQTFHAEVFDDSRAVHFSYWLQGGAYCKLEGPLSKEQEVKCGTGNIGYGAGRTLQFRQQGEFANLQILVAPDMLPTLEDGTKSSLSKELQSKFCFKNGYRNAELHSAAHSLFSSLLYKGSNQRHPLWYQAKGLEFISLFLQEYGLDNNAQLPSGGQKKILLARDRLLADLSQAPTINELARETGINSLKLKRGFKQLFGAGVYGVYQKERMHEANRRLTLENHSITFIAQELGYTNISHFAAAFKKQFGSNPSEIKKRRF
ncbi:MAG: helix-turn-helix transcriptional regulator [Paraglaciecola sp.]|nr:helix-turn-helix transcriptional regulator [Paraglaciecola sp.]